MAQISATRKELKNSFKKHYHVYNEIDSKFDPMTRRLLLFYSVESGLKCYLLGKIHKNNTRELVDYPEYTFLKEDGHDIKRLIRLAELGGQEKYKLGHFLSPKGTIEPNHLHQIWRYGIDIKDQPPVKRSEYTDHESKAEEVLKNVAVWLEDSRI